MSDQAQDLTSAMQDMLARMARLQAELTSLKEQAQALPGPQPTLPAPHPTSTSRRKALRRLAGGMLIGLAAVGAALVTGSGETFARTSANPAGTNNQVGSYIVPPGKALPTGTPTNGQNFGLVATDGSSLGVDSLLAGSLGQSTGVLGYTTSGNGLTGYASGGYGRAVYGYASGSSGYGLYGETSGSYGYGVNGYASGTSSYGVFGFAVSSGSYAGYFYGKGYVTGTLDVGGTFTAPTKNFKIDHPLDPANKYLYHTSVESPDMKNIYDGMVTLDSAGEATVTLPDWFEALNSDYRYQLTSIGSSMPDLFIAQEITNHQFRIGGGKPGQKVSWQVTGIRQDAYATAHRSPVEAEKTGDEKGKYLHPQLFGQPEEKGLNRPPAPAQKGS